MIQKPLPKRYPRKRRTDPLETAVESVVCKYARALNMLAYKFKSPSQRSVPDRIFITAGGWLCFVEFKRLGRAPTEQQEREINKLLFRGHHVFVCDSKPEGKALLDSVHLLRYSDPCPIKLRSQLGETLKLDTDS